MSRNATAAASAATAALEAGTRPGNPLVSLAIAAIKAVLYVLDQSKNLVTWCTLTFPGHIVQLLQYSFTISLDFPTLLGLFLATLIAATFIVRYRYLARYTQLKDPALPPSSPQATTELLPLSNAALALNERSRNAPFHNYLDDFLAAIRIFGYLEKPVFHELSRHLQTRRLGAGETLEIGTGDFWCVVEGKVQVFAPSSKSDMSTPPSPDPFSTGSIPSFNGYHLLNEVSTGGTLSSLFSILSLFTEDIKLSWSSGNPDSGPMNPDTGMGMGSEADEEDEEVSAGRPPAKSRTNSDVSQLGEGIVGDENRIPMEGIASRVPTLAKSVPIPGMRPRSSSDSSAGLHRDSVSSGGDDATIRDSTSTSSGHNDGQDGDGDNTLNAIDFGTLPSASASTSGASRRSSPGAIPGSRRGRAYSHRPESTRPLGPESGGGSYSQSQSRRGKAVPGLGPTALHGTIARATVDTTLAVIPAEAFRKLTRKFPKASGTIVQVVLERFSRVTFMTAHKFLGLTREILRSESTLNQLVSYPLPRAFYTGGGMQALRDRFQPESGAKGKGNLPKTGSGKSSPGGPSGTPSKDYFNYVPASPTVKAPSLPSITPRMANTPAAGMGTHKPSVSTEGQGQGLNRIDTASSLSSMAGSDRLSPVGEDEDLPPQVSPPRAAMFSPDTATRQSSAFVRQHSALRKQVAAGDLAMTRRNDEDENGGYYYRATAQTPGLPRMDTWLGKFANGNGNGDGHGGQYVASTPSAQSDEEGNVFDLKAEVVVCIAKSIGLSQQTPDGSLDPILRGSVASASVLSSPNSPMFPPHLAGSAGHHGSGGGGRGSSSKSPFGNVLDMMNASSSQDGVLGGMLREAVMTAKMDEDASSFSMSMAQESGAGGGGDGMRSALRDLENNLEIMYYKKGSVLVKEGERAQGLYYVIDGFLDVSINIRSGGDSGETSHLNLDHTPITSTMPRSAGRPFGAAMGLQDPRKDPSAEADTHSEEHLFTVKPGGIAGYLSSLGSTDSYVNITAKTDCFVGLLPIQALQRIIERRPIILLTLAKRLLSLLSPLVLHIDAALDWLQLGAGEVLYQEGDKSTDFYVVINGRLRSLHEKEGGVEVLQEYGQNDSIGELDVITGVNRSDTVHTIRDTELVRIPAALFDAISTKHPATTIHFLRLIASRVRSAMGSGSGHGGGSASKTNPNAADKDVNLKTVCVLGANRNVPVTQFAAKLKTSLEELGASTSYLDQGTVMRHLGRHAFARIGKLKIAGWLADQEQHYRTVLYVADTPPSSQWTLTCIRQADLVLIVGMGDDPSLGEYEKLLLATKTTARKELIILHDERAVIPGSTRPWLRNRPWLHAHHHVELPGVMTPHKAAPTLHDAAAIAAFKHLRERVETRIKKYRGLRPLTRPRRPAHMNDFARIARRLCGRQIGLVLGGGGARGISHIGMLQALEEQGVPIDSIGGCSIGSFVGGLYARETDLLETTGRTKQFAGRMGSVLRLLSDVTYPFVAYTTGHEFNRGIYKAFYNTHIEDFWIPFFANSTNITHSRMEVHRSGYAWRYVRASMTLAGLLPPLSDNGNMLVDGGYMDNTPIGPLRSTGIRDVIVVDVGAVDDTSPRNYGDSVSGWWIFINKLNPFYERTVPSMTEISGRLAYVASVKTLEDVKNDPHCLYIAMPVQQFETLGGFKQFSEVLEVGLEAAREALKKWRAEGRLPSGLVDDVKGASAIKRGNRLRRMSI